MEYSKVPMHIFEKELPSKITHFPWFNPSANYQAFYRGHQIGTGKLIM